MLQINNEDIVKLLWCIIGVEDDGFVNWEVAFSVMFAVVHEDMISRSETLGSLDTKMMEESSWCFQAAIAPFVGWFSSARSVGWVVGLGRTNSKRGCNEAEASVIAPTKWSSSLFPAKAIST